MRLPELPFEPGQRVRFEDEVNVGDFIYFDTRSEPGVVLVRRLTDSEVRSCGNQVYRLDAGDNPTHVRLRPVRWADPPNGAAYPTYAPSSESADFCVGGIPPNAKRRTPSPG